MIWVLHIFSWLIYKLPNTFKAVLSDAISFLLEKVVRYRRKVVERNLSAAFPDKTEGYLSDVRTKFYRHLTDRIIESLAMVHFTEKEVRQFCEIENYEIVKREFEKGKSVIIVLGHCGSWELACLRASLAIGNDAKQYAVYTRIGYEPLNQYVKESRGKFGMQLFSMQEIAKQLRTGLGEKSIGIYLADQNHSNPKRAYWTQFLHQDTPFMTGPARFARAWDTSLFFVEIKQTARFHYAIHLELMQENVQPFSPEELTEQFARRVERQIQATPSDWLWSHKRWKYKRLDDKIMRVM